MPIRSGQTSAGVLISGSSGVLKISGGDINNTRSITISGSADIIFNLTGSNIQHTFPEQSTTLLGTNTEQSFSNKSGSFIQIQIPSTGSAPTFTPTQDINHVTMIYNTSSNFLYIYSNGSWRSGSFV